MVLSTQDCMFSTVLFNKWVTVLFVVCFATVVSILFDLASPDDLSMHPNLLKQSEHPSDRTRTENGAGMAAFSPSHNDEKPASAVSRS